MRVMVEQRQLWLAIILGVIGGAAWWYQQTQLATPRLPQLNANQPDYIVDAIRVVIMDATGQPQRRLQAKQLRHYTADDHTELDAPILWLRRNAIEPPWQIAAAVGQVSAAAAQMHLGGGVLAERAATADSPAITVATSAIEIFPETHYAETRHSVALHSGANQMTAERGMQLWFGDQQRAKLFGRVRTQLRLSDAPAQ